MEPRSHDTFDPAFVQQMQLALGDDAVSQLMMQFADDIKRADVELARCSLTADFGTLGLIAHGLKGTASMFGAQRLTEEAAKLCRMCATKEAGRLQEQVRLVCSLCRQAVEDSDEHISIK